MNKVELIGRLTKDPELRYTSNNIAVASYTLAVNDKFGEKETTTFINAITWNKSAEFISKYFKKGQQIALTGRLSNNDYEDKNGNKVHTIQVISESIEFVGNKAETPKEDKKEPITDTKVYQEDIYITDDDLPF